MDQRGGALGVIDRAARRQRADAIENITPDVPVPRVTRATGNTEGTKQYSSPIPLDSVRLLASIRGPVLVRDFRADCQFRGIACTEDGTQWFCAQPIRPRRRPPAIPTYEPKKPDDTAAGTANATLFVQDVYQGLKTGRGARRDKTDSRSARNAQDRPH